MVHGEDYYTRKGDYAIKGLVICDDAVRINWVEMYFEQKEYLLGDSAFSTSAVMIPDI